MRITQKVWQVGGSGLTAPEDAGIYLIRFGEAAALIDAGCGEAAQKLFANIAKALPETLPITHLFLTHCHFDHSGGAEAVRQRYGCKVSAHQLDAVFLEKGDSDVTAASWYGSRMQPLGIDHKIVGSREAIGKRRNFRLSLPGALTGIIGLCCGGRWPAGALRPGYPWTTACRSSIQPFRLCSFAGIHCGIKCRHLMRRALRRLPGKCRNQEIHRILPVALMSVFRGGASPKTV